MINSQFENKSVIITGVSRGLGLALAETFIVRGAKVFGCSRTSPPLQHPSFFYQKTDLRLTEDINKFAKKIKKTTNKVDVVIHNAALPGDGGIASVDEAQWDEVFAVNVKAPFLLTKSLLKLFKAGTSVVFVTTIITQRYRPEKLTYTVSKSALTSLAHYLACELGPKGIRVNIVAPSIFPSSFRNNNLLIEQDRENIVLSTPLRKICTIDNIVSAVLFLCSDEACFINGAEIPVDGGRRLL